MTTREEVFYVRVNLTGPPDQMARAVRYAKENVRGSTESLHRNLGVASSVAVYTPGVLYVQDHLAAREVFTGIGDAEEPPLTLEVVESED